VILCNCPLFRAPHAHQHRCPQRPESPDKPALRAALATLKAHEALILETMRAEDEGPVATRMDRIKEAHDRMVSALYFIVETGAP
jgi:hypothetical protein